MRRYWFILALTLLATVTVIAAITAVMLRSKKGDLAVAYFSERPELSPSSYWIFHSGSVVVSREHLVKIIYDPNSAYSTILMILPHRHRHRHLSHPKTTTIASTRGHLLSNFSRTPSHSPPLKSLTLSVSSRGPPMSLNTSLISTFYPPIVAPVLQAVLYARYIHYPYIISYSVY